MLGAGNSAPLPGYAAPMIGRELMELELDLDGSSWPFDLSSLVASPPPFIFSPPPSLSLPPLTPSIPWTFEDRSDEITSSVSECARLLQNGKTDTMAGIDNFGDRISRQLQAPAVEKEYDASFLIKERMTQALRYIKDSTDQHVLVQVWVPVKSGSHWALTTSGQPFVLDPQCTKLLQYRMVSSMYIFSVEDGDGNLGLPGRVFTQRLPEWTPNVQYYSSEEYKRLQHALHFNVRGTLALPVFECSGQSCLGVVELVMTSQKIKYSDEVNKVCKALEAVNLKSSEILDHPSVQISNEGRQAAPAEILEILTVVCETQNLPLAQTWVPCMHHAIVAHGGGFRKICSSFDGSCMGQLCLSTTDAFYVVDPHMWGFREACVEHHLHKGQGVAGKAFASRRPFFCTDVTMFSKSEYPLVHYARMFGLAGCVAICLRSNHSGDDDYILEFFLPPGCKGPVEQKVLLDSILTATEECFHKLNLRNDMELQGLSLGMVVNDIYESKIRKISSQSRERRETHLHTSPDTDNCEELNGSSNEGTATHLHEQHLAADANIENNFDPINGSSAYQTVKLSEKRRGKAEKMVSLEVLQQYFSGSLKDAARSLGVCPTTMKRICRQHGISRWPSRKINKVNRSLCKLKHVLESVQGVEAALDLTTLGSQVPATVGSAPCPDSLDRYQDTMPPAANRDLLLEVPSDIEHRKNSTVMPQEHDEVGLHPESGRHSHSSRGKSSSEENMDAPPSQGSCQGSPADNISLDNQLVPSDLEGQLDTGFSTGFTFQHACDPNLPPDLLTAAVIEENLAPIDALTIEDSGSCKDLENNHGQPMVPTCSNLHPVAAEETKTITIKASYKEDIIRFRLLYGAGVLAVKHEISKRLKLEVGTFDIKYLDDDHEWVILGCDSDFEECIELSRLSGARVIRLSVYDIIANLGSSCESSGD